MIDRWTGPVRFQFMGDKYAASTLQNVARKELGVLRNLMGFQNLQQDQRTVHLSNGIVVNVQIVFGQARANIFVPVHEPRPEELTWPEPDPGKIPEVKLVEEISKKRAVRSINVIDGGEINFHGEVIRNLKCFHVEAGGMKEVAEVDYFFNYGRLATGSGTRYIMDFLPIKTDDDFKVFAADYRSGSATYIYECDVLRGITKEKAIHWDRDKILDDYQGHRYSSNFKDYVSVSETGGVIATLNFSERAGGGSRDPSDEVLVGAIFMYNDEIKTTVYKYFDPTDFSSDDESCSASTSGECIGAVFASGESFFAIVGHQSGSANIYRDDDDNYKYSGEASLSFTDSIEEYDKNGNFIASVAVYSGSASFSKEMNSDGIRSFDKSLICHWCFASLSWYDNIYAYTGGNLMSATESCIGGYCLVEHCPVVRQSGKFFGKNREGFIAPVGSRENKTKHFALAYITFRGGLQWELTESYNSSTEVCTDQKLYNFIQLLAHGRSVLSEISASLFIGLPIYHRDDGYHHGDGYIIDLDDGTITANFASIGWIQDKNVKHLFFIDHERPVVVYSYRYSEHELYDTGFYFSIFDRHGNMEEDSEGNTWWEWKGDLHATFEQPESEHKGVIEI